MKITDKQVIHPDSISHEEKKSLIAMEYYDNEGKRYSLCLKIPKPIKESKMVNKLFKRMGLGLCNALFGEDK